MVAYKKRETIITKESKYYKRHLPHFYISGECYFITYHLADSIPQGKVNILKNEYST